MSEREQAYFVLEEQEFIEIKVKAYKTFDGKKGIIFIRFKDASSEIIEVEEGTELQTKLGEISGATGHVVLDDSKEDVVFAIPHKELWVAFQEALGKG